MLETTTADGSPRATHVWFVEPDGELWVEAGAPGNGWFVDVATQPELGFRSERRSGRFVAVPVDTPDAQARVRGLLREKYGLRDRWVGLLVDSSRSVAVRLDPAPGSGGAPSGTIR